MLKNILSAHCGKCFFQDLLIRSIDFYKANEIEAPVLFGETKLLFQFFPFPVFCVICGQENEHLLLFLSTFFTLPLFLSTKTSTVWSFGLTRALVIFFHISTFFTAKNYQLWNYCLLLFSDVVTAVVVVVVCLSLSCH